MTRLSESAAPNPVDVPRAGDADLLRDYASHRSEPAFAELVRRHLDAVYSSALRRVGGDAHLAQDVTQRVFVALARKASTVAAHAVVSAWLYTVTRNEAANAVRTEQRRKVRETEAMIMHHDNADPQHDADWSRVAPVLDEVVDELSETDRTAILLRFVDGRPFAEIGAALRVSDDAARVRVDRALDKLRARLERRGVTSTAAGLGIALANHAVLAAPAGLAAIVTGGAVATGAVGPLSLAIQFMVTSKTTVALVGIAALAMLGTTVRESNARQAADGAQLTSAADTSRLESELRATIAAVERAERARDAAQANLVAATTATPAPAPVAAPATNDPLAAGREFLAAHPEAKALWDERERANLAVKLGPVFQVMNLSDSERDQITTIMLNGISGVTTMGGPGGNIALRREPTLNRQQAESQLVELLGPDRTKRFAELSVMAPSFDLTAKMATALYRTEPLNPEQTAQMMQIFAKASPVGRGGNPNGATIDWTAITADAAKVLTPTQVAGLTVVQRNFEYQQAVQKLSRPGAEASVAPKTAPAPAR